MRRCGIPKQLIQDQMSSISAIIGSSGTIVNQFSDKLEQTPELYNKEKKKHIRSTLTTDNN